MLLKEIKYENLLGETVTEKFAFHMSKSEVIEVAAKGELQPQLELIMSGNASVEQILKVFRGFVGDTVGQVSEDGKRFMRSAAITEEFMTSGAFDALLFEFLMKPGEAAEFVNNVFPADLKQLVADVQGGVTPAAAAASLTTKPVIEIPLDSLKNEVVETDPTNPDSYTDRELLDMDDDLWNLIVGPVQKGMPKRLLALSIRRRVRTKEVA